MIASLPARRPPRGWDAPRNPAQGARADLARYLDQADGDAIDLVIFDETHHLRNVETMNHRLGLLATAAADHKLLLSALWDAAFDGGLVSFADDGAAVASPRLGSAAAAALRLAGAPRIDGLSAGQRRRLAWHRATILAD